MMIYKLAGEAFPDIKIPELTAFYEELEKWSDIFEGRPKWRKVKRSGGLVRGTERMVNMLNTGKILCDEETARQKAVSSCIREFADKGIPAFVDKAGREWSPEAYINMDIRTTVSNTANAAQDAVCDKYGVDLIEVSSHMGARPKCAPYQGKIFSRSNQSGIAHDGNGREIRYEPLSSTSYGQPDGLFGINCRHQKYPFVDGVNFQTYFPYDEAENAKRYKEFQTQRAMERDIRKKKRECMMLEETGDTEALKAARADLRQSKKAYAAYSDEHGLRTREDRLRVERSKSAANSGVDKSGGNDIIEARKLAQEKKFDYRDFVEVIDEKSVSELKQYVAEKMGINHISGIDKLKNGRQAHEILSKVEELSEKHGKRFSRISVLDYGDTKIAAETVGSELRLNIQYLNRPGALQVVLDGWEKSGYIPKGCNSGDYVAKHEYFHLLTQDLIDEPHSKIAVAVNRTIKDRSQMISINGQFNCHEYVADLLSATSLTKSQKKLKGTIMKIIEAR